jgi:argonaute family protein
MNLLTSIEKVPVVLNHFFVKNLEKEDLRFHEYQCKFSQAPQQGDEQRAISSICYKIGVTAVRLGSRVITKEEVSFEKMKGNGWELVRMSDRELSCVDNYQRKALETFERKILEKRLKSLNKTAIQKVADGGLIWWITDQRGVEKSGEGWEVHRGRKIDVIIDSSKNLYLEIDIHHRFYTPWTLHQWLENYPDIPINYVRSTYKDKNNNYISWQYGEVSEQSPKEILIEGLGISLADYHRNNGASEEEIDSSIVVYVRRADRWNSKNIAHLSKRLSPSLTMEMLANIAEQGKDSQEIKNVFGMIKKNLDDRLKESKATAQYIINNVYDISREPEPLRVDGYVMPKAKLLGSNGQEVDIVAKVRYKGCAKIGETKFGCLNLFNERHQYPEEVGRCLLDIEKSSRTKIEINSYRAQQDFPDSELDQQMFWQKWSDEGIKTILVVMDWSPNERKQKIRVQALQAGIATQFIVPKPKADKYKALNVVLGLLCKAGWQPVRLAPLEYNESADLIIGFDTGTNRELYYGTSAFAVLADGQSLGWELPDIQRGESFSGKAIWQTVSKLVLKFHQNCKRYPKKLLLMRDGLVQEGEFQQTIEELAKSNIAVDVVGVRKSGTARMGQEIMQENGELAYRDARIGTVIFAPKERSFTIVTSQPVTAQIGSAKPLRVVHEYGNTSLDLLALQTYQLTQLHPASGFRSCRLPWVLHLADRSSKEFQRLGQINILQNIGREKLIAV